MELDDIAKAMKNSGLPSWATEETLKKVAQSLNVKGNIGDLNKTIGRTGDTSSRTFIGGLNSTKSHLKSLSDQSVSLSKTFKSFAAGSAGLVASLAQSKGKFSDLNPFIDAVGDGFKSIADEIPIIGGFFKALAGVTTEVMKLNNAIADDLVDNFYALGKAGFNLNGELQYLQKSALMAGVSFDGFTSVIQKNTPGIIAFGGDIERGTKKFVQSLEILTDPGNPEGFMYAMKSFGYGAEETAAFLGDFIDQNRNSMRLQQMSEGEVAKVAFEYAKNLRIISELTGAEVDALKEAQMAQVADGAFQGKLQEMRNQGLVEEARAIEEHAAALMGVDPTGALTTAYKEQITFGTAVTKTSALLMRTLPQLDKAFGEQSVQGAIDAMAGLTKNTDALRIAQFGMLEDGNPLSDLITSILPQAQLLATIGEGGLTFEKLKEQQNAQVERLKGGNEGLAEFEATLLRMATELEQFPKQVQAAVVESLQRSLSIQMGMMSMLVSSMTRGLGKPMSAEEQKEAFINATLSDKISYEEASSIYDDVLGGNSINPVVNAYQNYGGGPTGSGLYLVGERGPELLKLSQGSMGHVYNHGQSKSMLRGRFGGGGVNGESGNNESGNIIDFFASGQWKEIHKPDLAGMALPFMGGTMLLGPQGYPKSFSSQLGSANINVDRSGIATIKQSMDVGSGIDAPGLSLGVDYDFINKQQKDLFMENMAEGKRSSDLHEMTEMAMQMQGHGFPKNKDQDPEGYAMTYQDILTELQKQTVLMKKTFEKVSTKDGYF